MTPLTRFAQAGAAVVGSEGSIVRTTPFARITRSG